MTSEPIEITLVGGKNQYGFKTDDENYDADAAQQLSPGKRLPITRVNARVALVGLTYDFNNPFYDRFELTEVALFNARKSSTLFGTSLVNNGTEFFVWLSLSFHIAFVCRKCRIHRCNFHRNS